MKYLAYYDVPENKAQNRDAALSAVNKITYICDALNRVGQTVEIVSASATTNRKGCKGKRLQISENTSLKLFSCMGKSNLIKRVLGRYLLKSKLFFYLLFHLKKQENLMVYHSVSYAGMVCFLKKIKKFRLILEVEEIYSDVNGNQKERKKENKIFSAADAFLCPAERLCRIVNTQKKPSAIIYGTYQAEPDRQVSFEETDRIHCVYAGTFDPRKGGAVMAAEAAKYLPENYHLHIIGFGSDEDVRNMQTLVNTLSESCRCAISYDGCLRGEEYIQFLQKCQIGLSTQNPNAGFNDTSFPSKILSYMANGLQVVTVRIPVVEEAAIGKWMHYYDEAAPEAIAKAILSVQTEDTGDSRQILSRLDSDFMKTIEKLLEG